MRVPFIVYADFESFTPQLPTRQPNPDNSYNFNDDDVEQIFIDTLEKNIKDIYKKFKFQKGYDNDNA